MSLIEAFILLSLFAGLAGILASCLQGIFRLLGMIAVKITKFDVIVFLAVCSTAAVASTVVKHFVTTPPIVNAGADQTVTMPSNVVYMNGSASDPDGGSIVSYQWTKVQGPAEHNIVTPNQPTTYINSMRASGTDTSFYKFVLTVVDDEGESRSDTALIKVAPNPAGNSAPHANAGLDVNLSYPLRSTTLSGVSSFDDDGTISSYQWTKLFGPTFDINNSASATPTISNLKHGNYVFQLTVTDNDGATGTDQVNVSVDTTINPNIPVPIKPANAYDIANASGPLGGGNGPMNYFDAHGLEDPANGVFVPNYINAVPFRAAAWPRGLNYLASYYTGDRGHYIVFDLAGLRDMFITHGGKFDISAIYALDNSGNGDDTLYCYNWDKVFEQSNMLIRRGMIARADSLQTPFAKIATSPIGGTYTNQWMSKTGLTDSMRYLMVRTVSKDHFNGSGQYVYSSQANFAELVIYGKPRFNPNSVIRRTAYTGPYPAKVPIKDMMGVNNITYVDPHVLQYDNWQRQYDKVGLYDDDTTAYPANTYNLDPFGIGPGRFDVSVLGNQTGRKVWGCPRGGSKRLEVKSSGNSFGHAFVGQSIPVTELYMEPEDPLSYERLRDFYLYYAWKFGHGTTPAPTVDKWRNINGYPGYNLGLMSYLEDGNEDPETLFGYVCRSNAIYDGWEHRLSGQGMHDIDPNMKLIMSGAVYLDSSEVAAMIFLCRLIRNDKKVIWDVFNMHWYPRTYNFTPWNWGFNPTYEMQIGAIGRTPWQDFMRERIYQTVNTLYNETEGDTTKTLIISEYGYDNFATAAQTIGQLTFPWTTSCVPIYPGFDSVQSKGIVMVQSILSFTMTPLRSYQEFCASNGNYDPTNNIPLLFYTSGRMGGGFFPTVYFANYWMNASFYNAVGDYVYQSTILDGDSTGTFIVKYRHQTATDSVMFAVFRGTKNGTVQTNLPINFGTLNGEVRRRDLSFSSGNFGQSIVPNLSGVITVMATEMPKFYVARVVGETPPPPPPPSNDGNKIRFGRIKQI